MRVDFRHIAAATAFLALASCADNATMPTAPSGRNLAVLQAPAFDYGAGNRGSLFGDQSSDFRLSGKGGTFDLGLFNATFPSGSICKSTDATVACVPVADDSSFTVHVTVRLTLSGVNIDFTPHMRFAADKPAKLSTDIFGSVIRNNRDFFAAHPSALRPLAMYYTPTLGATPVADYITDPTVVTHIDLNTGLVWRYIRHTSGYLMGAGTPCDPGPNEPDCIDIGPGREG
jgi:hypothetical protein